MCNENICNISLSETCDFFRNNDNFLILTHSNPDGDTLGSAFALLMILQKTGKKASVICGDAIPEKYNYFTKNCENNADEGENTVVAVDVADAKLLGKLEEKYGSLVELCIDHHFSNRGYAKKTFVNGNAAANCECIYEIAKEMQIEIDKNMALALYTGLSTDTGCFRYSNTTSKTLRIAADLLDVGIDAAEINRIMFETKNRTRVELERLALDGMEFYFDGKCAVITVTRSMYESTGCADEDLEGLTSIPRMVEGVLAGVTIRAKKDGGYKISVRTYAPADASQICKRLGGGGHIRAAGCQVGSEFTVEQAKAKILESVKIELEESRAGTVTDR